MYEMIEKEINSQLEKDRLQKLLQTVHEKNLKTEEAYQQSMQLYQSVKASVPRQAVFGEQLITKTCKSASMSYKGKMMSSLHS